jgi:hypothetical protein
MMETKCSGRVRAALAVWLLWSLAAVSAQQAPAPCSVATECEQMAMAALERQDYEVFHDLAWRALQRSGQNDAGLMYLLARAQSLSGRPDDARIMLRRLADMGVAPPDVETVEDFSRVRALPTWPELLEQLQRTRRGAAPAAAVASAAVTSPPPDAIERSIPGPASLRIPPALSPRAMAYDSVSRRFVFSDESAEGLKVVDEPTGALTSLTSAGRAGFQRSPAMAIDYRRGDLWVIEGATNGEPGRAIQRLQLSSARELYRVVLPAALGPARLTSLAVTPRGSVLVLDADGRRLLEAGPETRAFAVRTSLATLPAPTALALGPSGAIYIAHAEGIARVNTTGAPTPLRATGDLSLHGIEWLGSDERSLLALQRRANGVLAAVRLRVSARGDAVVALDVLGSADSPAAAIADNALHYIVREPDGTRVVARVALR